MITPSALYDKSGVFGLVFKGTAAQLAAVPDGRWTPAEGDLWYDTTNNAYKVYSGSAWVQAGAASVAMTGAAGGEIIQDGVTHVAMTSADADHWLTLPAPVPGTVVWISSLGGTGWELRSSNPTTIAINGGTGSGAESAVAATDLLTRCVCMSATAWIVTHFAAAGTESAADAAA